MALRIIKSARLLWNSSPRLPLHKIVACSSLVLDRSFHVGETNFKKRKTKEERVIGKQSLKVHHVAISSSFILASSEDGRVLAEKTK